MNPYVGTIYFIPRSNFLSGMGSSLGIGGNYYQRKLSPSYRFADYFAIRSDWKTVGQDLYSVLRSSPLDTLCKLADKNSG